MSSVNKVILVGNLGADPEMQYADGGDAICNLRIATTDSWAVSEEGFVGVYRGPYPHAEVAGKGRSGTLHHRD